MIQSLKMALKSMAGNKMRAFLTMLGIIIGVFALVVLVSLVNGATSSVTDAVSDLGSDLLTVTISDDKGDPIKLDTLTEWAEEEGIGEIAPTPAHLLRQNMTPPAAVSLSTAPPRLIIMWRALASCWGGS